VKPSTAIITLGLLPGNFVAPPDARAMDVGSRPRIVAHRGASAERPECGTRLESQGEVTCPHRGAYPDRCKVRTADTRVTVVGEDIRGYWTLSRPRQ
jgi:hypothetical protein